MFSELTSVFPIFFFSLTEYRTEDPRGERFIYHLKSSSPLASLVIDDHIKGLDLPKTLQSRYHRSYFTLEETETQRGFETCPESVSWLVNTKISKNKSFKIVLLGNL